MKNIFYKLLTIVLVLSSGCKKFLDIPVPSNELLVDAVFKDNQMANGAVLGIYADMANMELSYSMSSLTGMYSDELKSYSSDLNCKEFYENSLTSENTSIKNLIWINAYKFINQANAIIEALPKSNNLVSQVKDQIKGEALFFRAFWHFNLINLYGDVPLITSTDYKINAIAFRTPKSKIIQQIILDLKTSKELLNSQFVGADGVTASTQRVRINRSGASALLSKVYLYNNDFSNAEKQASEVISNIGLFDLELDLDKVFLKNSIESIFQLQPGSTTTNTSDGYNFILTGPPSSGTIEHLTINPDLLSAFELTDKRKSNWIASIDVSSETYYFPYKYKIKTGDALSEYVMVFRLSEQYLIRAEARANQNDLKDAIDDLDKIRGRAGLSLTKITSPNIGKEDLLELIFKERRLELFTEWGNRWFDIKRTNRAAVIMPDIASQKGGTWSSTDLVWPIPTSEILNNNNLKQNDGYN